MSDATKLEYSELDDKWAINKENATFYSQAGENGGNSRIIFNEFFRDGTISSDITIQGSDQDAKDGAIIFRYKDPKNYYNAGLGGYGLRFFIAKLVNGQGEILAGNSRSELIERFAPYKIKIICSGNRIVLKHNGVPQLTVSDGSFGSGLWGLHSYSNKVEFKNPSSETLQPKCFVIMPFDPEFNEVYQVIRETVEKHSYACIRADERYLVGPIMDDVHDQIGNADLVVADLTGRKPNVFYEVGYAAALGKPVIQIAQSSNDLPFDVQHLRTFAYSTKYLGDRKLARDLSEAIRATA